MLLLGMKMMSTGLEVIAGDRLQTILKKATSNRFLAVFVGIIATIAINSSTAVTIITVGFVNSGLMNLTQSIGIIMGANVGTTLSAQLIAFRIDTVAPLFIFVGIIMYLFFKKRSIKNLGYVILGFGILFFSISVMGSPLRELGRNPEFNAMLTNFQDPLPALLVGLIFTAIVQSSSATTGLLVAMQIHFSYISQQYGVPNPLSFETSAFIILGTNIGGCITTLLASIPANRDSKRAAIFHGMYSIIGSIVFGLLILVFPSILDWFTHTWEAPARQVAMFHSLFNVATMLLLLPFVTGIVVLMRWIVPVKDSEKASEEFERKLMYLDTAAVTQAPAIAVVNAAQLEISRMGKIASHNLALSLEAFFEKDEAKINKTFEIEKTIDFLNHRIASKLVEINNMALSISDGEKVGRMFKVLTDIERVGDHAENIAEYAQAVKDGNLKLSEIALEELKLLGDLTTKQVVRAVKAYENQDNKGLSQIKWFEKEIDKLSIEFVENHMERLKDEKCNPQNGVIFTDMITDLERTADHARNIAFSVLYDK